jgi:hypothetical protein
MVFSGILKGRLDLEYSASTDTNSVHRALHIIQPGPDLSGDYTCFVSTFSSEDRKTKRMLVFGESGLFANWRDGVMIFVPTGQGR